MGQLERLTYIKQSIENTGVVTINQVSESCLISHQTRKTNIMRSQEISIAVNQKETGLSFYVVLITYYTVPPQYKSD